ncbi:MAG: Smr/MutS family protein [Rhodospirillales bacterium]|nr:Smr/MutS family protein [Rhodospirillales bacterium]MCB9964617.1 Smr/MutS family protein [Rhodospirillales bacterium]MCB9979906.1 Smr/MutS family protein [Rhodospirillales bacterium]
MPFRPTDEDDHLWTHITRGLRRLGHKNTHPPHSLQPSPKKQGAPPPAETYTPLSPPPELRLPGPVSHPPQLNRRDAERLRKGRMEIEARLDLHGLTQIEAFHRLHRFILSSVALERRCVLVITGKGKLSEPGILRQKLPEWLRHHELSPLILQAVPAQPKDGGTGATYIYLKKPAQKG